MKKIIALGLLVALLAVGVKVEAMRTRERWEAKDTFGKLTNKQFDQVKEIVDPLIERIDNACPDYMEKVFNPALEKTKQLMKKTTKASEGIQKYYLECSRHYKPYHDDESPPNFLYIHRPIEKKVLFNCVVEALNLDLANAKTGRGGRWLEVENLLQGDTSHHAYTFVAPKSNNKKMISASNPWSEKTSVWLEYYLKERKKENRQDEFDFLVLDKDKKPSVPENQNSNDRDERDSTLDIEGSSGLIGTFKGWMGWTKK